LGLQQIVRFLGDRSDVKELLPGLDMFVLSSITEGYPIALLEACASALPIVSTNVAGNPEIVREGENGFLVPPRSPQELADAILRLIRQPAVRTEMGLRNHRFAHDAGSIRVMAERYQVLYALGAK
jgi:glycosyltransferase involved in cell wall biosynthesis